MKEYHILSLSGGKDSTALAFFIKDTMPEIHEKIEYVFCDTECELPETYDYLNKIEVFLGKPITRLKPYRSFEHLFQIYKFLPAIVNRWCTVELKTKVYRKYIYDKIGRNLDNSVIYTYVGIRADERGRGLSSSVYDSHIITKFPFQDYEIYKSDVMDILEKSGIGVPDYYKWRKRSGCYFCFYQSKNDWLNLYENHPDLFFKAMEFEKFNKDGSKLYGWNMDMKLADMLKPENIQKIRGDYNKIRDKYIEKQKKKQPEKIFNLYSDIIDYEEDICDENSCPMCR